MKKFNAAFLVLALAGLAGPGWAAGPAVTLKASYFLPSDGVFRDVYSGGPFFGADITVPVSGLLRAWAGAEYFGKKGRLSVSEEETKVRIIPLYAGLRLQFGKKSLRGEGLGPYIGAAAAYFFLHEENPLGTASKSGLGLLAQAGGLSRIGGPVYIEYFAAYRFCTLKTNDEEPLEADLGGLSLGLGLTFKF